MKPLPEWMWSVPNIFYFLTALYFMSTIGIHTFEYGNLFNDETSDVYRRVTYLRVLYDAVREASYMFSSGVFIHVLLAIYGRMSAAPVQEIGE